MITRIFLSRSHRPLTPETIKYYRWLQLWIAKLNRIYSPLLLPVTQILLITLSTLGVVGIIKYDGFIRLMVGSVGATTFIILYLLLRLFGTLNMRSDNVIKCWKAEIRNPQARRAVRALGLVRIDIGSFYFGDMGLILTSVNIIFNISISVLLVVE